METLNKDNFPTAADMDRKHLEKYDGLLSNKLENILETINTRASSGYSSALLSEIDPDIYDVIHDILSDKRYIILSSGSDNNSMMWIRVEWSGAAEEEERNKKLEEERLLREMEEKEKYEKEYNEAAALIAKEGFDIDSIPLAVYEGVNSDEAFEYSCPHCGKRFCLTFPSNKHSFTSFGASFYKHNDCGFIFKFPTKYDIKTT